MSGALERNNVKVTGDGPASLVFGHGLVGDQRSWRLVAPRFESTHRVVVFDHVGSGNAERAPRTSERYATLGGYAADVIAICEALDLYDVVFVGHSMSAAIGLLAAIAAPERIGSVAMIAGSPRYLDDEATGYVGGFTNEDIDGLLRLLETNFIGWTTALSATAMKDPELASELRAGLGALDPASARRLAELVFRSDLRAELEKVHQRVLIVQCARDDIVPIAVGAYLRAHLSRSELRVLDAAGHCPQLSDPDLVEAALREHLASILGPAS